MPPALTARLAGLPRWAWVLIGTSGIVLGVYLRQKRQNAAATAGDPGVDGSTDLNTVSTVGDSGDPSLYGTGMVTAPSSVVPVDSPTIPQGYPEAFASLAEIIQGLAGNIENITVARTPDPVPAGAPTTYAAPTGGGPPAPAPPKLPPAAPPPLPAGYNRGNTVAGRTFPGIVGWRELSPDGSHRRFLFHTVAGTTDSWWLYTADNGPYKKGQWRNV